MGRNEGKWARDPPDPRLEQRVSGQMCGPCVSPRWERGWREQLPCREPGTAASGGGNKGRTCAGNCRSGNCLLWFSDPQARTEVPSVVRSGARRWSRCSAEQSEVPLGSAARTLQGRGAGWPTEVEGSKAFPDTQPSPGAGTLRQLNPDFLSQLPVPRPRGLGNSRAPAAGHRSTLSRSNCTSSSCLK